MPECPHCHEYYFGNPNQCPKCYYDFKAKTIRKPNHVIAQERIFAQWEIERDERLRREELERVERQRQEEIEREAQRKKEEIEKRNREIEQRNRELELAKQENDTRTLTLLMNPRYEYQTVSIKDTKDGILDKDLLQSTLMKYAMEGWRLHTIFSNELGKSVEPSFIGSKNSTIEETILIFERCVKLEG